MLSTTKDDLLYMAKINKSAQRFQELAQNMAKVISIDPNLNTEERSLLAVGFKNIVQSRRKAWRIISSLQAKEQRTNSKNMGLLRVYKAKIEGELNKFCNEILSLIDSQLIPIVINSEALVFYLKMKGDCHKYIFQYVSKNEKDKHQSEASQAYRMAHEKAEKDLKTINLTRLGLAMNYAIFYYEIKKDCSKACGLADTAFQEAIEDVNQIQEQNFSQTVNVMGRLKDSIKRWTSSSDDDDQ